jgi:hypothetical protein
VGGSTGPRFVPRRSRRRQRRSPCGGPRRRIVRGVAVKRALGVLDPEPYRDGLGRGWRRSRQRYGCLPEGDQRTSESGVGWPRARGCALTSTD